MIPGLIADKPTNVTELDIKSGKDKETVQNAQA
jgi:hypothetical protein